MMRFMLPILVAMVFSSNIHRSHGAEPDTESLLRSKPVVEEGAGIVRLKQERYNAALRELESRAALWRGGKSTLADYMGAADRLLQSEPDTSKKRLLVHFRFAQQLEAEMVEKLMAGVANAADFELTRYRRIDIEIRLLEE